MSMFAGQPTGYLSQKNIVSSATVGSQITKQ